MAGCNNGSKSARRRRNKKAAKLAQALHEKTEDSPPANHPSQEHKEQRQLLPSTPTATTRHSSPRLSNTIPTTAPPATSNGLENTTTRLSPLLALPTELLLQIALPLLTTTHPHPLPVTPHWRPITTLYNATTNKLTTSPIYPRPTLMHASRALYTTLLPTYYAANAFLLSLAPLHDQAATLAAWPAAYVPTAAVSVRVLHLCVRGGGGGAKWGLLRRVACFRGLRKLVLDARLEVVGRELEDAAPLVRVEAENGLRKALRRAGFEGVRGVGVRCGDCERVERLRRAGKVVGACSECLKVWVGAEGLVEAERAERVITEELWEALGAVGRRVGDVVEVGSGG